MQTPEINTIWRNLKKGTYYRVWQNAVDSDNENIRVIYQNTAIAIPDNPIIYTIEDSEEEGRLGSVYLRPIYGRFVWTIDWHTKPILIDDRPAVPIAWARPLELWYLKFAPVSSEAEALEFDNLKKSE